MKMIALKNFNAINSLSEWIIVTDGKESLFIFID